MGEAIIASYLQAVNVLYVRAGFKSDLFFSDSWPIDKTVQIV
jgi:hypothetical protein